MVGTHSAGLRAQNGTSMIEVLVTIIILAIGLLGLAGLQSRLQSSEMEAYQRAQALILLNDMASRIAANRTEAASYAAYDSSSPLGVGMTCPTATGTAQEFDVREWCEALQGAAESMGGSNVGAMVGGRGCIDDLGDDEYMVTVAWQGLNPVSAPPDSVACGEGEYDGGTACVNDLCRRAVTTIVRMGNLGS
jgi:type IV pilus assembly protein PilV